MVFFQSHMKCLSNISNDLIYSASNQSFPSSDLSVFPLLFIPCLTYSFSPFVDFDCLPVFLCHFNSFAHSCSLCICFIFCLPLSLSPLPTPPNPISHYVCVLSLSPSRLIKAPLFLLTLSFASLSWRHCVCFSFFDFLYQRLSCLLHF